MEATFLTRIKLGDAVMAIVVPKGSHEAYREQIVLDARSVVRAPAGKSHAEAATLPMNGLTARLTLDLLKLSPGQVIAVTGAAGAYGGYVIQLAKAEGLTVIADASEKDEKLRSDRLTDVVVPRRGDDVASWISGALPSKSRWARGRSGTPVRLVIPVVCDGEALYRRPRLSGHPAAEYPLLDNAWNVPMRRSGEAPIGCANRSRRAKSRLAWQRSTRRNTRPTPIVGWRLAVREDGWSFNSDQEDKLSRRRTPVPLCRAKGD